MMREVAGKEGFVDGDVLECGDGLSRLTTQNPVNQQKRVAMRKVFQNFIDIHGAIFQILDDDDRRDSRFQMGGTELRLLLVG
jgi:hypothetical protein